MKSAQTPESVLQSRCFQWAYNTYPQIRGLIFSVPNGGTRNMREAMVLRATGVTPGIPDMLILYNGVHGIEFKTGSGTISPAQKKIHAIWAANGIPVHIVRSEGEFEAIVKNITDKKKLL